MNVYVGDDMEDVKLPRVGDEGSMVVERPIGTVKRPYIGDEDFKVLK